MLPLVVVPADHPRQISESPQLERLTKIAELSVNRDPLRSIHDQLARVRDADVMINSRGHVHWNRELLAQLPRLRMITTCSIGTDAIDLKAAADLGIVVSNIPGKTAPVVAEHAIALLLAAAKRVAFQTAELKSRRWTTRSNVYLAGKTLGVVGTGAIGREVIRLASALGMNVIAWTFHPTSQRAGELGVEFVSLDDLLSKSDAVTLHVKLTERSRYLIGDEQIRRMKSGAILVNTARGAVVDNQALVQALDRGHLAGAAIDVFETEPLPANDPILSCEQVVLTPHSADSTPEGVEILNGGAVDNVIAFLDGSPQNVVT